MNKVRAYMEQDRGADTSDAPDWDFRGREDYCWYLVLHALRYLLRAAVVEQPSPRLTRFAGSGVASEAVEPLVTAPLSPDARYLGYSERTWSREALRCG